MKKTIKNLGLLLALFLFAISCQEDDVTFGNITAPTNLEVTYEIVGADGGANEFGDGSGKVNFKATADNALTYKFTFSDQSSLNAPQGTVTKQFTQNGINTYTVTAIAYGTGGVSTSTTLEVTVFSDFSDPETLELLTGGSTKVWYWKASAAGHLGLGPNNDNPAENASTVWYTAGAFEKAGSPNSSCLYNNVLTFSQEGDAIKYTLDNGGSTFFNVSYVGVAGGSQTEDFCLPYDTSGEKTVTLAPANSVVVPSVSTGTSMIFSDGGFMGYYIGATEYEILSITATEMKVRAVQANNPANAWYHTFTTVPVDQQGGDNEPDYSNLVWQEEFDTDGAPDPSKWTMETGTGENGWGNNEKQYYRAENAVVDNGILKITAKAENFGGMEYTSARMMTHEKYFFTYGKVEIRAKLPSGSGTWPALWMLGSNFETNEWPACGEIDIMEHVGNSPGEIHGTLHYPGNSGGNANTNSTNVPDFAEAFHVYSVIWSPTKIRFFVDGNMYHTFDNSPSTVFNHDFFLILNVAMGGNFGGEIAPGFTQSTMEVDYIRVYQE
ncbi:family 16 glycosylhydrolase [Flavobacterium sp. MK4S-17]|uniref:family 16 glycosylhydrolase n=1 Tax=Flavobacterium sp. MK4S-17 TaxID=2543737 RepID=UPI00135A3070|nr:family 16 glycosylhydrolase [Flavobacterium sp. MK4S-17]